MFELGMLMADIGAWLIALGLFLGGIVLILWVGLKLFEVFNGGR
jgi:hypothetical protein